jgi:hypothetical protein
MRSRKSTFLCGTVRAFIRHELPPASRTALSDPGATTGTFRAACREVLDAGEQQEHLIEALLTLARSQRGLSHRDPVDLHDITTDVLLALEREAVTRTVKVDAGISPASLLGDARLIERLISNLMQNALRYNMPGGLVQVTSGVRERRDFLKVINTGPIVAAEDIERLLQPFQRLHTDRTGQHDGHGLGLSIVAAIARAHDARLSVHPAPGGGLDIEMTFPAATPGSDQAAGAQSSGCTHGRAGRRASSADQTGSSAKSSPSGSTSPSYQACHAPHGIYICCYNQGRVFSGYSRSPQHSVSATAAPGFWQIYFPFTWVNGYKSACAPGEIRPDS